MESPSKTRSKRNSNLHPTTSASNTEINVPKTQLKIPFGDSNKQKTSTPFHLSTGGAPHSTNASYLHSPIDGRHENTNLMGCFNVPDMSGVNTSNQNIQLIVPNLGYKPATVLTNSNISNINNNANSLSMDNENVMSYQRVKKIITQDSNDEKLRQKELMLKHLKSIDLSKYSFPNENKPKTEYTYARTSSYLKECKDLVVDDVEMPNLCRRMRKSPNNSVNNSTTNNTVNLRASLSSVDMKENSYNLDQSIRNTKRRLSIYEYMRSFLNKSNTETRTEQITATVVTQQQSYAIKPQQNLPLTRNLGAELDDDTHVAQLQKKESQTSSTSPNRAFSFKNLFGLDGSSKGTESSASRTTPTPTGSTQTLTKSSSVSTNASTSTTSTYLTANQNFVRSMANASTMTNGDDSSSNVVYLVGRKKKSRSCWPCLLLLALLLPALLFGLSRIEQNDHLFEKINNNYLKPHFGLGVSDNKAEEVDLILKNVFNFINNFYENTIPYYYSAVFNNENAARLKETFSKIIDYKPSIDVGKYKDDFFEDLKIMKEKLISDTIKSMDNTEKPVDVELIRKELDEKFNYTLTLMSNKLADQSLEIQMSKSNYDNQLKQMKSVLNELESRYSAMFNELQEQQKKHLQREQELLSQQQQFQQQQAHDINKQVDSGFRASFSDEYVSFKKIEEYINRTFYLYNADKTGMTDFASESVGGSILFTRCTENYVDNSRWFTVFDFPITRIHVSPRVVIQGQIQPGNCWAFKGSKADLFIKLAARIRPTAFSIEHIPKELSITGSIDSAPQNFTIYGYENKDDIRDDNHLILGNFRYDNNSKNTLQFFTVQYEYPDKPISVVELKIESNSGNKDYTCLYKFRVHGELFKKYDSAGSKALNSNENQNQNTNLNINKPSESTNQN